MANLLTKDGNIITVGGVGFEVPEGGGELPFDYEIGDFTPVSNLTEFSFRIKRDTPIMVFVLCPYIASNVVKGSQFGWLRAAPGGSEYKIAWRRNTTTGVASVENATRITISGTTVSLVTYNTSHFIMASYKYIWIALWEKENA